MAGDAAVEWSAWAKALLGALRDDAPLPGVVRPLLAALVAEPPAAAWHPTGFIVIKLHEDERGALRLHLWPAGAREQGQPCWLVHDHVWDLRSHVLCGEVESRGHAVTDDEAGASVLYAVEYGEGRSSWMRRSERRVCVSAEPPRIVRAGERYEVLAGSFHASRVRTGDFAATLAATRPTGRARPWVVGTIDAPRVVPVERPIADERVVRDTLTAVEAALGGSERPW